MSLAQTVGAMLAREFPGVRVTSTDRSKAEQDALVASGATSARNSQHLHGTGLDIVVPSHVSNTAIRKFLSAKGYDPGEFIDESGQGKNQGTGAHLHIGLAPKAKGGDPASDGGGSTYDRVARQRADNSPDMRKVWQARAKAGKPGGMSWQEAAVFDQQNYVPPPGFENVAQPKPSYVLPVELVHAYNSHQMDDDPEARAEVERLVKDGEAQLPKGMKLEAPKARTTGERFGMGVRDLMSGVGSLADLATAPVKMAINVLPGNQGLTANTYRDMANSGANTMGLAKPESATENILSAVNEGGVQGLVTAGAALPFAETNAAAKVLSSSPLLDTVSGGASGASSETARQAGAGPVGQFVAGLAGGVTPAGLVIAGEKAATHVRAPKNIQEVVSNVPRSAVIDEAGNLTPDGQEIAARHNVTPEEVVRAYEPSPEESGWAANDPAQPPSVAKEATNDAPVQPAPDVAPQRPVEEAPTPQPVQAAPEAPVAAPETPATALDRVKAGQEFGVDYTRGQATKSFDIQDKEQQLTASNGPEAEKMRQFRATQQEQVKAASDQFRQSFDDPNLTAEERGAQVQDALRELRDLGQAGVSALYKQAKDLGADVSIDTSGIKRTFEGVMVEADIPDQVKRVIEQEAARYGLIGKPEAIDASGAVTNEAGVTTVKLDDGTKIKFRGEPQTLRLDNAEEFRKVISRQYPADGPLKLSQELKRSIDDAVEDAATRVAAQGDSKVSDALKTARSAHQEQVKTFKAKDVVQSIVDWKKGAEGITSVLKPDQVMQKALASTSDLKRIKAVLLTKPTVKSKAVWRGIQAHGLAQVFEKATTRNTNINGEITEAISGAKLRSSIAAFGVDKLKVLLDPDEFNTLMKLRRVIEDVTSPITGTVNHSGSGTLLMRLMSDVDNKVTGAFASAGFAVGGPAGAAIAGAAGRTVAPIIKQVKEAKAAAETLKGVTEYSAEQAATETAKEGATAPRASVASKVKTGAAKSVKAFIEVYSDPRLLAPVIASAGGAEE